MCTLYIHRGSDDIRVNNHETAEHTVLFCAYAFDSALLCPSLESMEGKMENNIDMNENDS